MKPEILYFKNLKYAYWRLEAVVEVVDRREGDDLDEVALWIFLRTELADVSRWDLSVLW